MVQITYMMKHRIAFRFTKKFSCYVNMICSASRNVMSVNQIYIMAEYCGVSECNLQFPIFNIYICLKTMSSMESPLVNFHKI